MKKISSLSIFLLVCLSMVSCGYQIHGSDAHSIQSSEFAIIEENSTISIGIIEQSSIHMDIPFHVSSILRDEVALRRLGRWENTGKGDYMINVTIPTFRISSFEDANYKDVLIFTIEISLILNILDSKTGEEVWNSGVVSHTNNFEGPREEEAIADTLKEVMHLAFEDYQGNF